MSIFQASTSIAEMLIFRRPGIALYTVFGFMAGFSGWLLWQCFMGEHHNLLAFNRSLALDVLVLIYF